MIFKKGDYIELDNELYLCQIANEEDAAFCKVKLTTIIGNDNETEYDSFNERLDSIILDNEDVLKVILPKFKRVEFEDDCDCHRTEWLVDNMNRAKDDFIDELEKYKKL